MIVEKECSGCGIIKPLACFSRDARLRDGHTTRCKDCRRTAGARWRDENRERLRGVRARWYEQNKERLVADQRRRRVETPEKFAEHSARRRVRVRNQRLGRVDYTRILERDGLWCYLCEQPVERAELDFDHVIPIARGGPHSESNIRVSHRACNKRKGARIIRKHLTPELLAIPLTEPDRRVKTHCPQGHPYEGENLFIDSRGYKVCRTCRRERAEAKRKPDGYIARGTRRLERTHCPRGHEYTPENTYEYVKQGRTYRYCRECNREAARKRHTRLKASA